MNARLFNEAVDNLIFEIKSHPNPHLLHILLEELINYAIFRFNFYNIFINDLHNMTAKMTSTSRLVNNSLSNYLVQNGHYLDTATMGALYQAFDKLSSNLILEANLELEFEQLLKVMSEDFNQRTKSGIDKLKIAIENLND